MRAGPSDWVLPVAGRDQFSYSDGYRDAVQAQAHAWLDHRGSGHGPLFTRIYYSRVHPTGLSRTLSG